MQLCYYVSILQQLNMLGSKLQDKLFLPNYLLRAMGFFKLVELENWDRDGNHSFPGDKYNHLLSFKNKS